MRKISVWLVGLLIVAFLTGCTSVDVIAVGAKDSFKAFANNYQDQIAKVDSPQGYELISPNNQKFYMSTVPEEGLDDLIFTLEAEPFISAGLDVNRLSEGYFYDVANQTIQMTFDLGDRPLGLRGDEGIEAVFSSLTDTYRDRIGYHAKLDHFGIELGNGNMFEWAKDISTNDKDMVFVLNPEPFVNAGVDPAQVEGWVYTEVEVMDANQKPILVDKLLAFYNID